MPVVTLIYLTGDTRTVTAAEAVAICKDPAQARGILDAVTADAELQSYLRREMDKF